MPKSPRPYKAPIALRIVGVVLLPLTIFSLLSLFTYDFKDVGWLYTPQNTYPSNAIGVTGAWSTAVAYIVLGLGAWLLPFWFFLFGWRMMLGRTINLTRELIFAFLFQLSICSLLQLGSFTNALSALNIADPGGAFGRLMMTELLLPLLNTTGSSLIMAALLLASLTFGIGFDNWRDFGEWCEETWNDYRLRRADENARLAIEQKRLEKQIAAEQRAKEKEDRQALRDALHEERLRKKEEKARQKEEREKQKEEQRIAYEQRKEELRRAVKAREEEKAKETEETVSAPKSDAAEIPAPKTSSLAESPENSGEDDEKPPLPPYELPPLSLLTEVPSGNAVYGDIETRAKVIVQTLAEFNLEVEITNISKGPVVTTFELLPAPGIKVERIAEMAKTIEMRLRASSIRIQAPIPGKGVVGIEVPNDKASPVTVREILDGKRWQEATKSMEIPLMLGKDVSGNDLVCDLATVPHLLVAGATGSGKSVCINAILTGLLMSRKPDELRLILVDPKIVEFSGYNALPHLVVPVITDPKKVALGLRWAINEMDRRYRILHVAKVKNIVAFNNRHVNTQPELFDNSPQGDSATASDGLPVRMPYLVIVVDELADLMLQVGPEIQNSITRLAQLSRAVGIHLILATQRPTVKIITGTIKANFPGRIAFQVAQGNDSRTILDAMGAESLIGKGDMLFLNPRTGKLIRAQGAFISDPDAERVVNFIREQRQPDYIREVQEKLDGVPDGGASQAPAQPHFGGAPAHQQMQYQPGGDDGGAFGNESSAANGGNNNNEDELYATAVDVVRRTKRASTSSLQRALRIGYNRAARLIDMMEANGIVGPPRGSDPREILIDLDGEIPQNVDENEISEENE